MISAADMDKLRMGIQNRCRVKVRGVEFEFRPLTIAEVADATTTSLSVYGKLLPDQKHTISESRIFSICTLVKASELTPGNIGVTESTLNLLTPDELGYLYREYNEMVAGCNPGIENMLESELIEIVAELKKNPSQLTELSFLQRHNLLRYLLTRPDSPQDK